MDTPVPNLRQKPGTSNHPQTPVLWTVLTLSGEVLLLPGARRGLLLSVPTVTVVLLLLLYAPPTVFTLSLDVLFVPKVPPVLVDLVLLALPENNRSLQLKPPVPLALLVNGPMPPLPLSMATLVALLVLLVKMVLVVILL